MKKRGNAKLLKLSLFLILLSFLASNVSAWARHDLMTKEVVKDLGWLDRFSNVTVSEYMYDDPTINQIRIRYYNDEPGELGPHDFYYHALYEPVLFFTGEPVGGGISAKQILTDFSDEPDWELDQNLDLSWMQGFSGESQGYRHIYYPTWSFHVPMGFVAQGQTPERADHFYNMAKLAFEKGDTYWGFRYLARTMHYIQDMSQPYHTRQLYWRYISLKDPYDGTIQNIKNYHFAYESFIANRIRMEQEGQIPTVLVSAIRYSLPVQTDSPSDLVKYIALRSHWRSSATWKDAIDFLGTKHLSSKGTVITTDEFFSLLERKDAAANDFMLDTESRMVLFGKATKSFLEFARRDLNLDEYEP
ncbi:hypothetical protein KY363_07130 [Candidatus Woesearchaeota archaeon]|nr:hypothetical protein [Candidatus Woesearchaeota archaeon]